MEINNHDFVYFSTIPRVIAFFSPKPRANPSRHVIAR